MKKYLSLICALIIAFGFPGASWAQPVTITYPFTGSGPQTYTVPAGVTTVCVDMQGGTGGAAFTGSQPGKGGRVQCALTVSAGQVLNIYVGGAGIAGTSACGAVLPGAFNGGGSNNGNFNSGGGGGGSDIRIGGVALTDRAVVAGGGGGGGSDCGFNDNGGAGGGVSAGNGLDCGFYNAASCGTGGTQLGGGSAGTFAFPGTPGTLGNGGVPAGPCHNGAGGGGGYYGGGAGGDYGGGGGGSSYTSALLATGVIHTQSYNNSGNGVVKITPCPVSGIITGIANICVGDQSTLTPPEAGGVWSSGSPFIAAIGPATGTVTGTTPGTAVITYTETINCCSAQSFITVTVNPLPTAITGTRTVCQGLTTSLGDIPFGGVWSSANTAIATITASGVVTGVTQGTSTISYRLATSCYSTAVVTVNPLPANITGVASVCAGNTTNLNDVSPGGIWTSNNVAVATIGIVSGLVSGVSPGLSTISYTDVNACYSTIIVTVNATPAAISGTTEVCRGLTTTLTDVPLGGTWFSGNTAIATITSGGVVTGVSPGTSKITYTSASGCFVTATVTVDAAPTLHIVTGGGSYCASDPGVHIGLNGSDPGVNYQLYLGLTPVGGSVAGTGAPIDFGLFTIAGVYTVTATSVITSCPGPMLRSATVTISPLPAAVGVSGGGVFCANTVITASNGGSGTIYFQGTASGGTSLAIPSTSQVISASGTYYFRAQSVAGCWGTEGSATVTIGTAPVAITGVTSVCIGQTSALSDATSGGKWKSGTPAIASVDSMTGVVTGLSQGTATITYAIESCFSIITFTVNLLPAPITGTPSVCAGLSTTLSDSDPGGTWSSDNTTVATVVSTSGVVTGLIAGVTNITYSLLTGCYTTLSFTVNPSPPAIAGASATCVGTPVTITDASPGGAWSSSNTTVANIGTGTGTVSALLSGTSLLSYTLPTGCRAVRAFTVNALPLPIGGSAIVCAGSTTLLTDGVAGGTWTSGNTAIATAGSSSAIITGVSAGTTLISYTLATGCRITKTLTVITLPSVGAITGASAVCIGSSLLLAEPTTGGTWSSSNTAIATVGSSGVVTGITVGTAIITYTVTNSCGSSRATANVSVITSPVVGPIAGPATVCAGTSVSLSDVTPGGTWLSSNTAIATIGTSGIATGITPGAVTIVYSVSNSCGSTFSFASVSVFSLSPVTGTTNICAGTTTVLADAASGGTWTSSNASVASIGSSTGLLGGGFPGAATITYTLAAGCIATTIVNVNPAPPAITGTLIVCEGFTTSLNDAVSGGTWSSNNTTVATIDVVSGIAGGAMAGTTIITYTIVTGCMATATVHVNPAPVAGTITGPSIVCSGTQITLADIAPGGSWISGDTTILRVNAAGIVTGMANGMISVIYKVTNSCGTDLSLKTITVVSLSPITGAGNICEGSAITLGEKATVGAWSSSDTTVAKAGASNGIITGLLPGTAIITYSIGASCQDTAIVTVYPAPQPITGTTSLCPGQSATLADATPGGIWSGTNAAATVSTKSGIVTAIAEGTSIITYTLQSGCTDTILVNVLSLPLAAAISGISTTCIGSVITLSDSVTGGSWSSSNPSIVSIGSASGIASAKTAGTATISYTTPPNAAGCTGIGTFTVTTVPAETFTIRSKVAQVTCFGTNTGGISLAISGGKGPYQYMWSNGDSVSDISHLATGSYKLTVTDLSTRCSQLDSFMVTQPDSLIVNVEKNNDQCKSSNGSISVTITGGAPPYYYLWSNNATGDNITGLTAATYYVTVTDINKCERTVSVKVEDSCKCVVIHNVITPNGNGLNDMWVIEGIQNYPDNIVQVFDKLGDIVYEKKNYSNDWTGIASNGTVLPPGTYYYLIRLVDTGSACAECEKNIHDTCGRNAFAGYILIKR